MQITRPYKVVQGCEPGSDTWRQYLTASRVPSVLGLLRDYGKDAEYERNLILGQAAEEERNDDEIENMHWGTVFEPSILAGWAQLHNQRNPLSPVRVRHRPSGTGMLVSTERPWLGATPDGWGYRRDLGLFGIQVKKTLEFGLRFENVGGRRVMASSTVRKWGKPEEIPEVQRTQCEIEMYVSGVPKWLLLVHVGGRKAVPVWLERNDRRERRILEVLDLFWESVNKARSSHGAAA